MLRRSMDAGVRMSMDSMRSGVSPGHTQHGPVGHSPPTADYRSSSLFSHFGSYGGIKHPQPQGENAPYGCGASHQAQEQH